MFRAIRLFSLLFVALSLNVAHADDAYFDVRLADLSLTEGKYEVNASPSSSYRWQLSRLLRPRVTIEGDGDAYWSTANNVEFHWLDNLDQWGTVSVRLPATGKDVVGRIDYPRRDKPGYATVRFKIAADQAKPAAREAFLKAKLQHYQRLASDGVPGTAWFRHQARQTELELRGSAPTSTTGARPEFDRFQPGGDFDDTFSLVSGNRALSENLQLDRLLQITQTTDSQVRLDTLEGISAKEIDWKPLIAGKSPKLDPLAKYVPADQHVVFFPTFAGAMDVADEADKQGTSLLQAAEPQSQDAGTVTKYQRQLGLQTTALGRLLGPTVIKSIALTGGDPYFRIGTDVALIFEAVDVAALRTAIAGQIVLNTAGDKPTMTSAVELGVPYDYWHTPDRSVSSYFASYGDVVVVTNSLAQLRRLLETHQQKTPAVASLEEFVFFRDRYPLGDANETAFIFLSDATIRRWCSPRWRIADSRRIRDLAVLAELQAANLPKLATGAAVAGPIRTDMRLSTSGEVRLSPDGVSSDAVGSLNFMTPIVELPIELVTKAEATAYTQWRDGYQRNFSWAFDPIGLRLTVVDDKLAADLTVMPLIDNTSYREFIAVSQGVKLKPTSGDPHETLLHAILALNKDSEQVKQLSGMASFFAPQLKVDILGWVGESIGIYVDDDPIWNEVYKAVSESWQAGESESQTRDKILERTGLRLPIAVAIEVSSAFKATAFLAGVRGFIDQTGPGMIAWETKQHGELPYVKISPTAAAVRPGDPTSKLAVYYSLTAEALTISLNEQVIQRSLDRYAKRSAAAKEATPEKPKPDVATADASPWLGENLCFDVNAKAAQMIGTLFNNEYQTQMQRLAWSNLPILNEWQQMFPNQDPAELHERLWGVKLVCPGGGKYVWNESRQTIESTVYGSPDDPKLGTTGPSQLTDFTRGRYGLTFEENGLRARAEMLRKK